MGSLEDDESEDSDDEEDAEESESDSERGVVITEIIDSEEVKATAKDFIATPSVQNFVALGSNRADLLLKEIKVKFT